MSVANYRASTMYSLILPSRAIVRRGVAVAVALVGAVAAGCAPRDASMRSASSPATAATETPITQDEALATFDAAWQIVHDTHSDPTFNGVD